MRHPDGDPPLWRVSLADIESDCAFSVFPGVDRTSVALSGGGFTLDVEGTGRLVAGQPYAVLGYPGDGATECRLTAGPARVLNIMVARGRARVLHDVRRVTEATVLTPAFGWMLAWCLEGALTIGAGETITVDQGAYTDRSLRVRGEAILVTVHFGAG